MYEVKESPQYAGIFVSTLGEVFRKLPDGSLRRLMPYQVISVNVNGKKSKLSVHRLVARTFLGPQPEDKPLVRHLDGDASNNRIKNLAYGDYEENYLDAVRHGVSLPRGSTPKQHAVTKQQAKQALTNAKRGEYFGRPRKWNGMIAAQVIEARKTGRGYEDIGREFGLSDTTIFNICRSYDQGLLTFETQNPPTS